MSDAKEEEEEGRVSSRKIAGYIGECIHKLFLTSEQRIKKVLYCISFYCDALDIGDGWRWESRYVNLNLMWDFN